MYQRIMSKEFDQAMKDLLDLAKRILDYKSQEISFATKKEKKRTVKNPILKALNNYREDYSLTDDEGNREDVTIAYKKYKVALLKGWKSTDWLKSTSAAIYSGAIEPDDKRKISLSAIYNTASRISNEAKESLSGLPIQAFEGKEELIFPELFQLHMYRVFLFGLSGEDYSEDITKLGVIVDELEKELKVKPLGKKEDGKIEGANGFVEGIAGLAKDFVAKMGVPVPDNVNLSTLTGGNNIMETISGVFTRPETKDFIADIGETMRGAKDFGEATQKIFAKFQDPQSMEKLKKVASSLEASTGIPQKAAPVQEIE